MIRSDQKNKWTDTHTQHCIYIDINLSVFSSFSVSSFNKISYFMSCFLITQICHGISAVLRILIFLLIFGLHLEIHLVFLWILFAGPAALHLAAQCGSLDAVTCLVGNMAKINVIDHNGWTPVHCAAFYNQAAVLELFLQRDKDFAELKTADRWETSGVGHLN